ncbi:MAG: hypothetical protein QF613_01145 [Candidatus Marinimicrobia bacterium]|jgi:hypothetical protein|nr:hypothetical protein [Candidatus Neomarinimicrobiota bacterium]MDP6592800.1 hypothetical protein [Candidatus Neomarinimicrobiota bacterium]MDP6837186.1 hypothetical protein [Candidatus Neomarinimicrobiota bacterium]MDP6965890.1 hypothetical protein [Candidatus Neomarinimicrobiota bacterium]|tara:strand:+ start:3267 stop:3401 length:135 start_codon:yes stop_codon:yes gene_type:complete
MNYAGLHSWDVSIPEAKKVQQSLREKLIVEPLTASIQYVAGTSA